MLCYVNAVRKFYYLILFWRSIVFVLLLLWLWKLNLSLVVFFYFIKLCQINNPQTTKILFTWTNEMHFENKLFYNIEISCCMPCLNINVHVWILIIILEFGKLYFTFSLKLTLPKHDVVKLLSESSWCKNVLKRKKKLRTNYVKDLIIL